MSQVSRSAEDTIRGYVYQFDKTILELLALDFGSTLTVEHLEDLSIESPVDETAIQCKYLEAQTLTNSTIRPPIQLMLSAFKKRSSNAKKLKFILFIHTGSSGKNFVLPSSVEELKKLLIYTEGGVERRFHEAEGLSDALLGEFLSDFVIEQGDSFDEQRSQVIQRIKETRCCSDTEADICYSHALRFVIQKAQSQDVAQRTAASGDLHAALEVKEVLYGLWRSAAVGTDKLISEVRRSLVARKCLGAAKTKLFVLGEEYGSQQCDKVAKVIRDVAAQHFAINTSHYDAVPVIILLTTSSTHVTGVKQSLLALDVPFNDGYELVQFSPKQFMESPVINKRGSKITRASFVVRIASTDVAAAVPGASIDLAIVFGSHHGLSDLTRSADAFYLPAIPIERLIEVLKRS